MTIKRRDFLVGGASLSAGAALRQLTGVGGGTAQAAAAEPADTEAREAEKAALKAQIPFDGAHQSGILAERPQFAAVIALDAIAGSRAELADGLRELSQRSRALATGYDALLGSPGEGPTPDSGVLGPVVTPEALTVTIGYGASLFDDRYGLAPKRPAELKPMPTFPDDALVAAETHGDVLVQLCANSHEKVLHAMRDVLRATRGVLAVRWKVEGFLPPPQREPGAGRNLLGFKDGTANPDVNDAKLMDQLVWTGDEGGAWGAGGTYAVVRIIRNRVEFWDRVARSEQELMIGRGKADGAPLGRPGEDADPGYGDDPRGDRIPLDAHIRLARPRTDTTEDQRILRRSYNYSRGVDEAGQLDMGLVFVSFQRSIERQFAQVQRRLAGEPLIDYIVPTGGGYFFLPPGAQDERDWVGSGMFV